METWRTFIAIELDAPLKAELRRVQAALAASVPPRSVRWVHPDGIHLTLKFLGDTPLDQVDAVKAAVLQAAAEAGCVRFSVGGLGCFPNSQRPRVVWVGLQEPAGALARLHRAVEAHVAPLGFPTERRPFSPHLTLGRVQQNVSYADVRQIGDAVLSGDMGSLAEMEAEKVFYIKSDLRPGGAVYETLLEAVLGARRPAKTGQS